jgi:hypothetical protein
MICGTSATMKHVSLLQIETCFMRMWGMKWGNLEHEKYAYNTLEDGEN